MSLVDCIRYRREMRNRAHVAPIAIRVYTDVVSSMSQPIWIAPATLRGLFFVRSTPDGSGHDRSAPPRHDVNRLRIMCILWSRDVRLSHAQLAHDQHRQLPEACTMGFEQLAVLKEQLAKRAKSRPPKEASGRPNGRSRNAPAIDAQAARRSRTHRKPGKPQRRTVEARKSSPRKPKTRTRRRAHAKARTRGRRGQATEQAKAGRHEADRPRRPHDPQAAEPLPAGVSEEAGIEGSAEGRHLQGSGRAGRRTRADRS